MLQIETIGNKIYTIAAGKLDKADYDKMLPLVKEKIEKHHAVHWYFQMTEFEGWTANAFWRDVKFDLENADKLNNVAIVGDKTWQEWMTEIMKPFTGAEIRYFDEADASKARAWISNAEG